MCKYLKLQTERKKARFTQDEMADKLNLSKSGYWAKENGVKPFTAPEMVQISKILKKSMDYLFIEEEEMANV